MADYLISLQLPSVDQLVRVINGATFPLAAKAVAAIASETSFRWKESVARARLWSGEKTPYIQSIKVRVLNDLNMEVYSDYKYAEEIEQGRPPRDLKLMLNTSTKVRVSQKGRRYLVIPMRHNTPGNDAHAPAMPMSVYELAKEMIPTEVTGMGQRYSGEETFLSPTSGMTHSGQNPNFLSSIETKGPFMVPRASYKWGGRLAPSALKAAGMSAQDRRIYGGMVKMEASTAGAKSSVYLTFRVMSEGSPGWVTKPVPGKFIAQKVAQGMQPLATAAISEAMRRMSQT
jgi:hypothetical protein